MSDWRGDGSAIGGLCPTTWGAWAWAGRGFPIRRRRSLVRNNLDETGQGQRVQARFETLSLVDGWLGGKQTRAARSRFERAASGRIICRRARWEVDIRIEEEDSLSSGCQGYVDLGPILRSFVSAVLSTTLSYSVIRGGR